MAIYSALSIGLFSQPSYSDQWQDTLDQAAGDTVYWHAWGGDTRTNDFISWVGEQTDSLYDVKVQQVKLSSTSEAVTQVLAEKIGRAHV
jgi:putative thiamine transport system substrate-binding protein